MNGFRANGSNTGSSSGCGSSLSSSQRKKHPQYRCGTASSVSSPLARSPGCYPQLQQQQQQNHAQQQRFGSSSSLIHRAEYCSSVSSVDSGTCGGHSGGGCETSGSRRDQSCQTMFTFPPDLDLTKFEAMRQFTITDNTPSSLNKDIESIHEKENLDRSPKRDRGKILFFFLCLL